VELKSVPTLMEYFSPGWVIERSQCNNYSRIVCNQFNNLIDNKKDSIIDSIASSLQPITSTDIHYPESKQISSLIIDFISTLKEKNLLPCIVFSDNRMLCENMAASVAQHFAKIENDLRKTTYKNQIEELKNRLELFEKTRQKAKLKKEKKSSKKTNHDEDNRDELNMMEEEENTQIRLSGLEQQLLNGILDEGTLTNRHGSDRELVDSLMKRACEENPTLVGYMERGVAYHHAGLNNKGRVAVEALFRNRYIQVVFSTSTLGMYLKRIFLNKKFVVFLYSFGYSYADENCCFCSRFNLS
jgi:superfamily II RNA helicase